MPNWRASEIVEAFHLKALLVAPIPRKSGIASIQVSKMWSSLRQTGRRIPSNPADQAPPGRGNDHQDLSYRSTSERLSPEGDEAYRPIVSPTAPILPPIPRVASIYGAPAKLPSFDQNERKPANTVATKENQRMDDKPIEPVPKASPSTIVQPSSNEFAGARNNFSRPFKLASNPNASATMQGKASNTVPKPPSTTVHHFAEHGRNQKLENGKEPPQQSQPSREQQAHAQYGTTMGNILKARVDAPSKVPPWAPQSRSVDLGGQDQARLAVAAKDDSSSLYQENQDKRPTYERTAQSYTHMSSSVNAVRPALPEQKSLQNLRVEVRPQVASVMAPQGQSQLPQLSNSSSSQPRSNKPMLTRLNPMSLLARRRSSQPASEMEQDPYRRNLMLGNNLPDNYDPRIRGSKVHDFSEPRTRQLPPPLDLKSPILGRPNRLSKSPEESAELSLEGRSDGPSPGHRRESERQHTPVFKEHFDDNIDTWRFDEKDRRNQSTTGILDRLPADIVDKRLAPLPPFAQKFPEAVTDPLLLSDPTFAVAPPQSSSSSSFSEELSPVLESPPDSPLRNSPPASPPEDRIKTSSVTQSGGSPHRSLSKHFQSNPSRFSFDMSGVGSAVQEKLLEDKHRQKNVQKARMSRASFVSAAATDDGFEYDDVDFDNDLEEEVPGVNVDEDSFTKAKLIANSTLEPDDNEDDEDDDDNTKVHTKSGMMRDLPSTSTTAGQLYTHSNINLGDHALGAFGVPQSNSLAQPQPAEAEEDDLYFDDGVIEDVDLVEGQKFDESVFDDEHNKVFGRPLRDLEPERPLAEPEAESGEDSSEQSTRPISLESSLAAGQNQAATTDTSRTSVQPADKTIAARRGSALKQDLTITGFDQNPTTATDNLAAYHDALALAAQKAAQEGRFERKVSIDASGVSATANNASNHVSFDDQLPIRGMDGLGPPGDGGLDDYEQEEDDFVAAANAEALENDDEGYYGREFGFYARANGSAEAEFVNGGYFGPASMADIKRSHSGRVNGQEPSLTPITERSEWSQRNSMISLAIHSGHGSFQPAVQTPGLAQIADSLRDEEDVTDNMTLSELMKLRKSAWGGSSNSLHSNGGSLKSASPPILDSSISMPPPARPAPPPPLPLQPSKPSDVQTHGLAMSPLFSPPLSAGSDSSAIPASSPIRRSHAIKAGFGPTSPVRGHSRNSSGADSVTYVKERDEDGSRWVMERRRTGEGGQMELLGREVVEGGRS